MIKLEKGQEPEILARNKEVWTNELLDSIKSNGGVPKSLLTRYNTLEVKDALRSESFGKCMYCESKVEHISDLNIEHIRPKARNKFPELTFEFTNLGLACTVCNRNKSDSYDDSCSFVNPYNDNPSEFFDPLGTLIWSKPNNARAKVTEITLDLNRPELLEARMERIKFIRLLIEDYSVETNASLKNLIRQQILNEVQSDTAQLSV